MTDRDHYTYGPTVLEDGELRYTSPSALDLADPSNPAGCLRRWAYRYVLGIKEPFGDAQAQGVEGHGQIETYLKTGQDVLSTIARTAMHAIPVPGPDLRVEEPIVPYPADVPPFGHHDFDRMLACCQRCGLPRLQWDDTPACPGKIPIDPAASPLSIEGIPVIGFIDLEHRRGENKGGTEITETRDPAGTVEVSDWKFTGNLDRNAKSRDQVLNATPMIAYGENAARRAITTHVRLSHVYISTGKREPARKVTGLLPREEVARRWEQRSPLARSIRDASKETDVNRIDANTRACNAYRGCPHKAYCTAGKLGTLATLFDTGDQDVSILDTLKPAPRGPAPYQPPAAQAAPAFQSAPPPVAKEDVGAGFADACRILDTAASRPAPDGVPFGWPPIAGPVAEAKARLGGFAYTPGTGYAGSGKLAGLPWVTDIAQFIALAKDVGDAAGITAPAPVAMQIPVATGIDHAVPTGAAERGNYAASAIAYAAAPMMPAIAPPDAPPSVPATSAVPVAPTPQEIASGAPWVAHVQAKVAEIDAPPVPEKKKASRSKKVTITDHARVGEIEQTRSTTTETTGGIYLHVDAVPLGPYEDLSAYTEEWCRTICEHYPESNGPAVDIRCSQRDELGFGKWKGVLAAFVKECARTGKLPGGTYFLRARGSDIGAVVAEALRACVDGGSWGVS